MLELGKREEVEGVENLTEIKLPSDCIDFQGKPTKKPELPMDHEIICGLYNGLYEKLFVCHTLEDMQECDKVYGRGVAIRIKWYRGVFDAEISSL